MLLIFVPAIFLGALLLFLVQPLAAKLILPLLGGSPAVWNTCLVFYQALLLGGYAYAHAIARLAPRTQLIIHIPIVLVAGLALPIALPAGFTPPVNELPIPWILAILVVMVGASFFVVSSASPLLQSWFSRTDHRQAHDPYFLYAASNIGSLLGLLAYPFLLEPRLTLAHQGLVWTAGYGLFVALLIGCGVTVAAKHSQAPERHTPADPPAPLSLARQVRWVLLAAIPSSLMLGVTHHVTTDIAAVPFLWIVPLSIYLITFILAFSRLPLPSSAVSDWAFRIAAAVAIGMPLFYNSLIHEAPPLIVLFHLLVLLFGAMLCHQRLAADRPDARRLTRFYLLLSLGGVIGGAFNALAAPLIFTWIAEYPLVILLTCFVTVAKVRPEAPRWRRIAVRAGSTVLSLAVILIVLGYGLKQHRPTVLHHERTFFGVLRAEQILTEERRPIDANQLVHGSTLHGMQWTTNERKPIPTSYYAPNTGIGRFFIVHDEQPILEETALVGLGIGTLVTYGTPGQRFTIFEIDPAVVRIASDPEFFTFLSDAKERGVKCEIILGDARLTMGDQPEGKFSLIVLDAFSSDAIPIHLITREALQLYKTKLRPGGVIAVHISNRYLSLAKPVTATARSVGLNVWGYESYEGQPSAAQMREQWPLSFPTAKWIFLSPDPNALDTFIDEGHNAASLSYDGPESIWTDDYSNLWRALKLIQR